MVNNPKSVRSIIALLAICLITRLFLFVVLRPWDPIVTDQVILHTDPLEYHQLATTIVHHHQFAFEKDGAPNDFRTPIYPLFISLLYAAFGEKPWIVLLFQIVIDTASCILLFAVIARFLNPEIALYASLFYALDPFLIAYSSTLYSETLFVFSCIVSFYLLSKAISNEFQSGTTICLVFSAFFFGITTLVRPIALYLSLIIGAMLFVLLRKEIAKALKVTVVFASILMLSISPWLLRNYITFNSLSLSTAGPLNFLMVYVTPMEMERRGQPHERELVRRSLFSEADSIAAQEGYSPNELNRFEKAKYWQKVVIRYVTRYPISFVKHYALGVFHSFANLETRLYANMLHLRSPSEERFDIKAYHSPLELVKQWLRQKTAAEIALGGFIGSYLLISYICLIIGLFIAWKPYNRTFLLLCLTVATYFILITGPAGLARYRLPSIPFYLVFVGIGMASITSSINDRLRNPPKDRVLTLWHPRTFFIMAHKMYKSLPC